MTTNMIFDLLANCPASELIDVASDRPLVGRTIGHILELLCSLEPEEMQRRLGERLSTTWHDAELF